MKRKKRINWKKRLKRGRFISELVQVAGILILLVNLNGAVLAGICTLMIGLSMQKTVERAEKLHAKRRS